MPYAKAFCDNCGLIFDSGIFLEENAQNISLKGNKNQCPNCGNMADIPDGLFSVVNNTIELLKGPEITAQRLKSLKKIISDIRNKEITNEEITKTLTENAPELSSLANLLPKTRSELYSFLAVIATIIGMLIAALVEDDKPNITINNVYENYNYEFVDQRKEVKQTIIKPEEKKKK